MPHPLRGPFYVKDPSWSRWHIVMRLNDPGTVCTTVQVTPPARRDPRLQLPQKEPFCANCLRRLQAARTRLQAAMKS